MTSPGGQRLLLDEMFSAVLAQGLRERGHDVLAVVEDPQLREVPDDVLYEIASAAGRRVVTENIKDFRPLLASGEGQGLLLTTRGRWPRSRRDPGPLLAALDDWLVRSEARPPPLEDWL